jgi:hypothetical protein
MGDVRYRTWLEKEGVRWQEYRTGLEKSIAPGWKIRLLDVSYLVGKLGSHPVGKITKRVGRGDEGGWKGLSEQVGSTSHPVGRDIAPGWKKCLAKLLI